MKTRAKWHSLRRKIKPGAIPARLCINDPWDFLLVYSEEQTEPIGTNEI